MDIDDFKDKQRIFAKTRPVEMNLLSCKELPHFVGYDITTKTNKIPVGVDYDDPPFHCEITLYQYDRETGVAFRHVRGRILNDAITEFEMDNVPRSLELYYRCRVLIIYRLVYPRGLTLEDMEMKV